MISIILKSNFLWLNVSKQRNLLQVPYKAQNLKIHGYLLKPKIQTKLKIYAFVYILSS